MNNLKKIVEELKKESKEYEDDAKLSATKNAACEYCRGKSFGLADAVKMLEAWQKELEKRIKDCTTGCVHCETIRVEILGEEE